MDAGDDHHLPQEIIDEILLRLPVKSLLRFRCVSKSWRALISSERFVKSHLEKSSSDPSFRHHVVITTGYNRVQQFPLASLLFDAPTDAVDRTIFQGNNPWRSCNGLVCFKVRGIDFVLWNPSTRRYKNLPPLGSGCCLDAWGFGYAESSDDYKVFALTRGYDLRRICIAKVYSLKTGSWRRIHWDWNHEESSFDGAAATHLGGKLYWLRKFPFGWGIMALDLEIGELVPVLELPDTLMSWHMRSLRVLDGDLCVLCELKMDLLKSEIWVLKQNDATPSWSKMATLPNPGGDALAYVGNGVILCCDSRNLAFYHPRGHFFEKLTVRNLGWIFFANIHVESLASLGSDCEAEEQGTIRR